jgi:hypothetical protein
MNLWKDLAGRCEGLVMYSTRDAEILNSYPFRLLCERLAEMEDLVKVLSAELKRLSSDEKPR